MKRLLSVISRWAEAVLDGLTVWAWNLSDFMSRVVVNTWEGLLAAALVTMVIGVMLGSALWWVVTRLLKLLWLAISGTGRGIGWLWVHHRSWFLSGLIATAFVVAGVLLYPTIKKSASVDPEQWLKVAKVTGAIMWGLILLPLLIGVFRRLRRHPLWLGIFLAGLLFAGIVAATWYLFVHRSSLWWLPSAIPVAIAVIWFLWWLFKRRVPASTGTPSAGGGSYTSRMCRKRVGPPALVVLILIAVDLWVLVTQVMSPGWHWPFFHWSTPTMWLRAWPLWAALFLTLLTLFADWGSPDRPNRIRAGAGRVVSIAFVFGLVIMAIIGGFAFVSHIRW